jgi:hypothetical protein
VNYHGAVAGTKRFRPAPLAVGIAIWDVWSRLSPAQRRQVLAAVRRHGPTVAAKAAAAARKTKR